jgi:SAM-dependent methyltransferase
MHYPSLAAYFPYAVKAALFGDRRRHGATINEEDADWQRWRALDLRFYDENQRESFGAVVNAAGHKIMRRVDLAGKTVLEIGPGSLDHIAHWSGKPAMFYAVDINEGFLDRAISRLQAHGVPYKPVITLQSDAGQLPFEDESIDVVLSFYSLEHLNPLEHHVAEMCRVLKPGGQLVGAIPCEGGTGWGLGRYLTTRRWLRSNGIEDPGKIISWEHPNFATQILDVLQKSLMGDRIELWPARVPIIDFNLVARFIFTKTAPVRRNGSA